VLGDDVMATALIDRVLHHCHLVNIRGNSYRMREHTELYRALQSDVENSSEASDRLGSQRPESEIETENVRNFCPPETVTSTPGVDKAVWSLGRSR
jgi:hypothetical protein